MNWAEIMVIQYEEGRKDLRRDKDKLGDTETDKMDRSQINSMINDMSFVIDWLKDGREPGKLRGIDKNSIYQVNSMDDMDMFPSLDIKPQERELTEEEKTAIYNKLKDLSPRERQCFILRESYLWSYKDISKELGVGIPSVQSYVDRAKKKLSCHKKAITA